MWLMVMFDLPVVEQDDRKAATAFRNTLLDMGFEMAQFSVYMRFCAGQARLETYRRRIEQLLPGGGKVKMVTFTDKQYEHITSFTGRAKLPPGKAPNQYDLF